MECVIRILARENMKWGKKLTCGLVIVFAFFFSQIPFASAGIHPAKNGVVITDAIHCMNGKTGDLPDIVITTFEMWYVIEPINQTDHLITQGFNINIMNLGNLKTGPYVLNITIYGIWSDHEEKVLNLDLGPGILGTEFSWDMCKLNWPSLIKPLQYRAEVSTGLQEENYKNNVKTIPCENGFRISGNITLSLLSRLISEGVEPIIFVEDVNPRFSINRTAFDYGDKNGSIYQYNFTAPLRNSSLQVRAFITMYPELGLSFPRLRMPLLCLFFSKVKVIGPPNPNENVWIDFQF